MSVSADTAPAGATPPAPPAAGPQPAVGPVRWYYHIPIVLLLGGLGALGIRSLVLDDARYGWGTFCKQICYEVDYEWIVELDTFGEDDGKTYYGTRRVTGDPGQLGEVHEKLADRDANPSLAQRSPQEAKQLASQKWEHNTRYSLGAVKSWMRGYLKWLYARRQYFEPDERVVGVRATVYYQVNVVRFQRDFKLPDARMDFVHPPDAPQWEDGDVNA